MNDDRRDALTSIHEIALKHGLKTATAESLTCGLISAALADTSGCSAYHQGGIAAYNLDAKVNLLGVDRELAASCNCVSSAIASQMAMGAQRVFGADVVIAVTGYAEPWLAGGVATPYAHIAVLVGKVALETSQQFDGLTRTEAREALVTHCLCITAGMMEVTYAS